MLGDSVAQASPKLKAKKPMKPFLRRRFLIAGLVMAGAIAFLMYNAFQGTFTYYFTVAELKARGETVYSEQVRVNGKVAPDSINWDGKNNTLRFTMVDKEGPETLPVVYKGVVPDAFNSAAEVVLLGTYTPEGTFQAVQLLAKCPSKYIIGG